jgi:hypothetical protein
MDCATRSRVERTLISEFAAYEDRCVVVEEESQTRVSVRFWRGQLFFGRQEGAIS